MRLSSALPAKCGLLLIDCQEKILQQMPGADSIISSQSLLVHVSQLLGMHLFLSEQSPEKLGKTDERILQHIRCDPLRLKKTAFSVMRDPYMRYQILSCPCDFWILAGLETHICVLQTAIDLKDAGKQVVVALDATGSYDERLSKCALDEMRQEGLRVACCESIVYDLLKDAKNAAFTSALHWIKTHRKFYARAH